MIVRAVDLAGDRDALLALDTGFVTDRIYRIEAAADGFCLVATAVAPPLHKRFTLQDELDADRLWAAGFVAVEAGQIVGFAAAGFEAWNRRAVLWHLYVAADRRGRGIGQELLAAVTAYALDAGARCLWLETSNVNFPAIQFYRRMGFVLCGLDQSLYAPDSAAAGETALYFVREIEGR